MASLARWPDRLAPPTFPDHNLVRYLAQSILTVAGAPGPLLPYEQALDVVNWHESQPARQARPTMLERIREALA
jgi:hypothetical protein